MHRHSIMDSKWTTGGDARAAAFSGDPIARLLEWRKGATGDGSLRDVRC
jgi:hypothetical protein